MRGKGRDRAGLGAEEAIPHMAATATRSAPPDTPSGGPLPGTPLPWGYETPNRQDRSDHSRPPGACRPRGPGGHHIRSRPPGRGPPHRGLSKMTAAAAGAGWWLLKRRREEHGDTDREGGSRTATRRGPARPARRQQAEPAPPQPPLPSPQPPEPRGSASPTPASHPARSGQQPWPQA